MYDTQQLGYPVLLESWLVSTLSAYQKFQEVLWGKGWNDDFCMLVTLNLYRFSHQFGTIKNGFGLARFQLGRGKKKIREQPKSCTVTEFTRWQLFVSYKQRQAANPGPPAAPAQWVCRTRSGRHCLWTDWWLWVPQEVTPPPWRSVFWTPSGIRENTATPVRERVHS